MGIRKKGTPRSRVRAALRQLWLRSRERAAALKREGYCCEACGAKQSRAMGHEVFVEVHHREGIVDWDRLIDLVYQKLLCDPGKLMVLCSDCHNTLHGASREAESAHPIGRVE